VTEDLLNKTLEENTENISEILTALANPIRLKILSRLLKGETEFSELQKTTGLSKTALTHHLNNLSDSEIIENPKRGLYQLKEDGRNILASIVDTYTRSVWKKQQEEQRRAAFITSAYERRHKAMEFEVKIVELEPMHVASFRAISETPEHDAMKMLAQWAQGKGYLNDLEKHPIFGFNNPNPSIGKKEYGYEFWIKVEEGYSEEGVTLKNVSGGRYAVTTCHNLSQIGELWMKLSKWVQENGYEYRKAEWLEKTHNFNASDDELVLDLYEPIK
jgi:DNA gyrase inhibitor GyrI/DNA-binding HxlR family transcriptional regulator